jgi:hypothetical protein
MTRVIAAGVVISTDDPAYSKATAELFESVDVYVAEQAKRQAKATGKVVESTSAAPGERRDVPVPPVKKPVIVVKDV